MAKPNLAMIPSAYADSKVYSVLPNNGDGDFTFNRDSSATRVGQNGLIQEVGFFGSELASQPVNLVNDFSANSGGVIVDADTFTTAGGTLDGIVAKTNIISLTVGKTYEIEIEGNTTSSGFTLGSGSGGGNEYGSGFGTHTFVSLNIQLWIRQTTSGTTNITKLTIREIKGDQPRLNYDISNGVVQSCPSLLLEPASTNLVTDYLGASWTTFNGASITANDSTSPEGVVNATNIIYGGTANELIQKSSITITSGVTYTISGYFKLKSGTLSSSNNDFKGLDGLNGGSIGSSTFNTINNTWKRFSFSSTSSTTSGRIQIKCEDSAEILIYGLQLEEQSYATSVIPTNGASQTRANETCNGAGTASTFNDTEGVIYAEIKALADDLTFRLLSVSDGSNDNTVKFGYRSDSNRIYAEIRNGGSSQALLSYDVSDITDFNKVAVKYKVNDFALWVNGVERATDASGSTPTGLDTTNFDNGGGGNDFYGNCKELRVYNEALTDAQLQTLTT